jgi:hypothetical protein
VSTELRQPEIRKNRCGLRLCWKIYARESVCIPHWLIINSMQLFFIILASLCVCRGSGVFKDQRTFRIIIWHNFDTVQQNAHLHRPVLRFIIFLPCRVPTRNFGCISYHVSAIWLPIHLVLRDLASLHICDEKKLQGYFFYNSLYCCSFLSCLCDLITHPSYLAWFGPPTWRWWEKVTELLLI